MPACIKRSSRVRSLALECVLSSSSTTTTIAPAVSQTRKSTLCWAMRKRSMWARFLSRFAGSSIAAIKKVLTSEHPFFLSRAVLLTVLVSDRRYFSGGAEPSTWKQPNAVPDVTVRLATGSASLPLVEGGGCGPLQLPPAKHWRPFFCNVYRFAPPLGFRRWVFFLND